MGYRIFVLCLKQFFVNWRIALRLSWFWALAIVFVYVAMLAITSASFVNMTVDGGDNGMRTIGSLLFFPLWLALFCAIFIGPTSIAIGWHRYVLRGEIPRSPYFFPSQRVLWPYIWRGIKIGLILHVTMIPLVIVLIFVMASLLKGVDPMQLLSAVSGSLFIALIIGGLLIMTLVSWLTMRLGLGLPGNAIGRDIRSKASWKMTGPIAGALFTAALLISALLAIPSVLDVLITIIFLVQPSDIVESMLSGFALFQSLLLVPISIGFYILSFFVGIGILTVIYGHVQEGKPI